MEIEREGEISREALDFSYRNEIADTVKIPPDNIDIQKQADLFGGEAKAPRFIYAFTKATEVQPAGFVKMAAAPETRGQLQRESAGMRLAERLGIPAVKIFSPYQETSRGKGLLYVRLLNSEQGQTLISPELIAEANPGYGARAAEFLLEIDAKRQIPDDFDTSLLKRDDERNASAETFWKTWQERKARVLDAKYDQFRDKLIDREELEAIMQEAENGIKKPIAEVEQDKTEYFVHNDVSPSNLFFYDKNGEPERDILLLDFEHAGAIKNQVLAKFTDFGNFFARCWPNPEMQQRFLITCLEKSSHDSETLETNYQLLKGIAVFGTIYLAYYGMEEESKNHKMSRALLSNLKDDIATLDKAKMRLGIDLKR